MIEFQHDELPDDESEEMLDAAREALDIDWDRVSSAELVPEGDRGYRLKLRADEGIYHVELSRPGGPAGAGIEVGNIHHETMVTANGGGGTRGEESAPGAATEGVIERYPWLDFPERVPLTKPTVLSVELTIEPPEEGLEPIQIGQLPEDQPIMLEAVVRAPSFEIEPSNSKQFELLREEDSSVTFDLTARREGPAQVRVDFYQNDRRIGIAERGVIVGSDSTRAAPEPLRVTPVQISSDPRPPELEITIVVDEQDPRCLEFTLHSRLAAVNVHHARMGEVRLTEDPLVLSKRLYGELTELARKQTSDPVVREARLAALGNELWQRALSQEMRDAYHLWKDRVQIIQITTSEPWIPWEMVKPIEFAADGTPIDEPYWCERFAISRWLAGGAAADHLAVDRVRPVVPPSNLDATKRELSFLESLSTLAAGFNTDTAYDSAQPVIDLLQSGRFSIMHIAAHGSFDSHAPDEASIKLRDRPLRPSDIHARFSGDRLRPLIFINACHGTRTGYAFTGLGGWADRLVRNAQVAAFVGASWEIDDELALLFATEFYTALLRDGEALAESFRRARTVTRTKNPANSSWLAYVLYGDPLARVAVS